MRALNKGSDVEQLVARIIERKAAYAGLKVMTHLQVVETWHLIRMRITCGIYTVSHTAGLECSEEEFEIEVFKAIDLLALHINKDKEAKHE